MRVKRLFLVYLCLAGLSAGAVDIVVNSRPTASIVTGQKAGTTELFAASELERIVKKISGAELKPGLPNQIIIGTPKTNPEIAKISKSLGLNGKENDSFSIKTSKNKIYVGANTVRGVLFGTMELMEMLGARWFWPGPDGEYVLKKKDLVLNDLNIESSPAFITRNFLGHYAEPGYLWNLRNKMTRDPARKQVIEKYGLKALSWGGHSFYWIYPDGCKTIEEYFAKYPDQFAMDGSGRRTIKQHCFTNPDTFNTFYKWIIKFWEEHPEVKLLNLAPEDTPNFCRCKECSKHNPSYNEHKFTADLIRKVNQKYPNKMYASIAYSFYKQPVKVDYPANAYILYCMYERCYKHMLDDKSCEPNQKAKKGINNWIKTGTTTGYYGYEYDATSGNMFLPLAPLQIDNIRYLRNIGVKHFKTELFAGMGSSLKVKDLTQDRWFSNRFSAWLVSKALWNPDVDYDKLLKEYCTYVYSKAAEPMIDYYLLMQKAWQGKGHVSYYFASPESIVDNFLSPETATKALGYLEKAEAIYKNAATDDEKRTKKVLSLDKAIFMRWKKIVDKRNDWLTVKKGGNPGREAFLKNAKPGKVLYQIDLGKLKSGDKIQNLTNACVVAEENGSKFIRMVPPDDSIFGNHPRHFKPLDASKWVNYETSFKFRFPEKGGNRMEFWVLLRLGGERFDDNKFRNIDVRISDSGVSVVQDNRSDPRFTPVGNKSWSSLGMKNLERGKWYDVKIRMVDMKMYVSFKRDGKWCDLLSCPVTLGGGYVNIRAYKNFIGVLDFADFAIREIPSPSMAQLWQANVPYINATPNMTGNLEDACWGKAWHGGVNNRGPLNRKVKTELSLFRNDKALYIKAVCYDDDISTIKAAQVERDDDQWKDDCIEVCLDPDNTRTDYYYLISNPLGKQYDAMASIGMKIDKKWNGKWNVASYIDKNKKSWTVIFELPYLTFGTPTPDSVWLLGINRGGTNIRQSWTDGSNHNPLSFKTITFK